MIKRSFTYLTDNKLNKDITLSTQYIKENFKYRHRGIMTWVTLVKEVHQLKLMRIELRSREEITKQLTDKIKAVFHGEGVTLTITGEKEEHQVTLTEKFLLDSLQELRKQRSESNA